MDSVTRIVCETVKAELERQIPPFIAATDALKAKIAALEAENAELKKQVAGAEAADAAEAVRARLVQRDIDYLESLEEAAAAARPFPSTFVAKVIASASSEKAVTNRAYYNPGHPFSTVVYAVPTIFDRPQVPNACVFVVYDPTTPVGCIELSLFQRLSFGTVLNEPASFKVVGFPPPLKSCTIHVSRVGGGKNPISYHVGHWKKTLEGHIGIIGTKFAVKDTPPGCDESYVYKIMPVGIVPYGAGIFTKDTELTILTEDDVL
jgi:hypothetical protein